MRAVINIARNDLRVFFASWGNIIGLTLIPIAFTLVLGWSFSDDGGPTYVRVDVVDLAGSAPAAAFVDELRRINESLLLCPMDNTPDNDCRLPGDERVLTVDAALARVRDGRTAAVIVIPAAYGADGASATVQIDYYSQEDPTAPSPVFQSVDAVIQRVNTAMVAGQVGMDVVDRLDAAAPAPLFVDDAAHIQFADALYANAVTRLEERPDAVRFVVAGVVADPAADGFTQSVPGMGSMFVMFTVMAGMALLVRERQQWTLQRLAVMPLRRGQILGGKILAYFTLGMIQYLIIFGVGWVLGTYFGQAPGALLAVMVAFVLCVTALTFALAPHMQSEQQASGLARLLGLTLAPLGGAWWPLEIVPDFMRTIGHLSPVAWAMDAFQKIIYFDAGLSAVTLELGVLTAAAAVLFAVGIAGFRVE